MRHDSWPGDNPAKPNAPGALDAAPTAGVPAMAIAGVLALLILLKVAMAHFVPCPFIFPDELIYTKLARGLIDLHGLFLRGAPYNFPSIGYPLVLVPAELAADPHRAFRLVQLTNAFLMTLGLLPLYALGRRLVGDRPALGVVIVTGLMPFGLYANLAMAENLFFPLAMAAVWLSVKAATEDGWQPKAWLGLVLGLCFLAKPQGLVLPPIAIAALGASLFARRDDWARVARRLVAYLPAIVAYAAVLGLHQIRTQLMFHPASGAFLGTYAGALGSDAHAGFAWGPFGRCLAALLAAMALATGFWPLPLFGAFVATGRREGSELERVYAATALALGVILLVMTARFDVMFADPRIQERYCFYVEPLLLLGALGWIRRRGPRPLTVFLASLPALALALAFFGPAIATGQATESPSFAALWRVALSLGATRTMVLGGIAGLAFLALSAPALNARRWPWALAACAVYAATLTGFALITQHSLSAVYASDFPTIAKLDRLAGPRGTVAFLLDRLDGPRPPVADFFLRQTVRVFNRQSVPSAELSTPLTTTRSRDWAELSALPNGSLLVTSALEGINLTLVAREASSTIYLKRGPVEPAFEANFSGRYADGWTDGACVYRADVLASRALRGVLEAAVETTEVPARLGPYPITIADGVGHHLALSLPVGQQQIVRLAIARTPDHPFTVSFNSPAWSPMDNHAFNDAAPHGFKLRWVRLSLSKQPGGQGLIPAGFPPREPRPQ